jgi:hypothetical protein
MGTLFYLTNPWGEPNPRPGGVSGEFELHAASPRTTERMQALWLARMAELFPALQPYVLTQILPPPWVILRPIKSCCYNQISK